MPEGDSIHAAAERLREALQGRELVRLDVAGPVARNAKAGTPVGPVEARGKHLLVRVGAAVLHTHLGLHGSWRVSASPGPRTGGPVRAVVEVDRAAAVCESARVAEVLDHRAIDTHPALAALGPDLMLAGADLEEAARRLGRLPDITIGEALLDQRVAAGIGNIYRNETLFTCGVSPLARVAAVDAPARERLLATAAEKLRARAARGEKAVYRRARLPCRRCGDTIRSAMLAGRAIYWCPRCQPEQREE